MNTFRKYGHKMTNFRTLYYLHSLYLKIIERIIAVDAKLSTFHIYDPNNGLARTYITTR